MRLLQHQAVRHAHSNARCREILAPVELQEVLKLCTGNVAMMPAPASSNRTLPVNDSPHKPARLPVLQELLGHCLELYQENRQQIAGLEEHLKEYGYDAQHSLASPADPLADVPAGGALLFFKLCCRQGCAALLARGLISHAARCPACTAGVRHAMCSTARAGVSHTVCCNACKDSGLKQKEQQIATTSSAVLGGRSHRGAAVCGTARITYSASCIPSRAACRATPGSCRPVH